MNRTIFGKKEHVLNHTAQRFQLTRPKAVGAISELIHDCKPRSLSEWEEYYWKNAYTNTKERVKITPEVIKELGERLYTKIQEVVIPEWTEAFDTITDQDCVDYIYDVTIFRSYDGYHKESAVYRELGVEFDKEILFEKTDEKTDSAMDVDYTGTVIRTGQKIGIQVKPLSSRSNTYGYSMTERVANNFRRFEVDNDAKVFIIIAKKEGRKSIIVNREIISEIRKATGLLKREDESTCQGK